jgi:hypothetical protein
MTSLTWNQFNDSSRNALRIPNLDKAWSVKNAALIYAEAGWYVLPVNEQSKHAGSYVGVNWPEQSTRDPREIEKFFKYDGVALALHVGKSNAVAFDVDNPALLPRDLEDAISNPEVPFQSTRMVGDSRRGHYLFAVPKNSCFGNSVGKFNTGFGDVRGKNGIIIVEPSLHSNSEQFGHYKWKRTGILPELPLNIALKLPQRSGESFSTLTRGEAAEFVSNHNLETYPQLLTQRIRYLLKNPPVQNTRHGTFQRFLCLAMKDAAAGFYSANYALVEIEMVFNSFKSVTDQTPREFESMALWAMAQVDAMTKDEIAIHSLTTAPHLSDKLMNWVRNHD